MSRTVDLLLAFTGRSLLQWFAWRSFLVTLVVNQMVAPVLGLAIWSAATSGSSAVTTYYLALLLAQLATVSYEHHTLSNGIYDGSFAEALLVPTPVVLAKLGENLAMRVLHVLAGLPVFLVLVVLSGDAPGVGAIALALPALVLAAAIRFLFTFTLALAAFWSQQAHGIVGFGETMIFLLGGSAVPMVFMPERVRPLVEALPFRAMLGFPAEVAAGTLQPGEVLMGYALQVAWLGAGGIVAMVTWRRGLGRFTAIGG